MEPGADRGATAAREALNRGADVVFGLGSGSGRSVLLEVAGTGFDAPNGALCISAEVDQWAPLTRARRFLISSVLRLPNEYHSRYWAKDQPTNIKLFDDALDLPTEYDIDRAFSTLTLIN